MAPGPSSRTPPSLTRATALALQVTVTGSGTARVRVMHRPAGRIGSSFKFGLGCQCLPCLCHGGHGSANLNLSQGLRLPLRSKPESRSSTVTDTVTASHGGTGQSWWHWPVTLTQAGIDTRFAQFRGAGVQWAAQCQWQPEPASEAASVALHFQVLFSEAGAFTLNIFSITCMCFLSSLLRL